MFTSAGRAISAACSREVGSSLLPSFLTSSFFFLFFPVLYRQTAITVIQCTADRNNNNDVCLRESGRNRSVRSEREKEA